MIIINKVTPPSILKELKTVGINYIKGGKSRCIEGETAYHPDMLYYTLSNGILLADCGIETNEKPSCLTKATKEPLKNGYPYDCTLNCFTVGEYLVCGRHADKIITDDAIACNKQVLYVKQGYAACSTIVVNSKACICSDPSISKALNSVGLDVLTVSNNGILLNGYSCGFIGGCALYNDENVIMFSGNIKQHSDYERIKSFCGNYGIKPYSLSDGQLYDYGGFRNVFPIVQ